VAAAQAAQAAAEAAAASVTGGTGIATGIHGATLKATPVDADEFGFWDSVSLSLRKFTWANLKAAIATGLTFTGLVKLAAGADIASAAVVDLTAATGNAPTITGVTDITAFTMGEGQQMELVAGGAFKMVYHATTMNIKGGADYTCTAGDTIRVFKDHAGVIRVSVDKKDGTAVAAGTQTSKILPFPNPTFNAGAMTIPSGVTYTFDYRSTTLGDSTVTTVTGAPAALVVPSGATLGLINGIKSSIVTVVMNAAGVLEYAVVNLAGGNDLSETGVISTTAISAAADSANVFYSTTARTNVAYRVVSQIDSIQTTAGTWAQAPSLVQGVGGQALATMSGFGFGQTKQQLSASRSVGTTYYNATGKPIDIEISASCGSTGGAAAVSLNGGTSSMGSQAYATGQFSYLSFRVLPGNSYVVSQGVSGTLTISTWFETR
jgi:hypothetical protein